MEAEPVEELPTGRHWQYEPKWDGFRAIVFRDGDEVAIQSRNGKPLGATSRNSCWRRTLGRHVLQTASSVVQLAAGGPADKVATGSVHCTS